MKKFLKLTLLLSLLLAGPVTAQKAQDAPAGVGERSAAESKPRREGGLWPTKKLMRSLLRRWAHEVSEEHNLNDTQREKAEEAILERWTGFLEENRDEIEPLVNEFIELRWELEPPEKEEVQDWARRADPVFGKIREQVEGGVDDFRKILTPMQRIKFEAQATAFTGGMNMAQAQIKKWEEGDFEREDFWEPTREERRRRREERRRAREEAERASQEATEEKKEVVAAVEEEPPDQVALEMTAWEKYVAEFIDLYNLNDAQRTTAISCLEELQQRALAHRDSRREEIARLEERIANNSGTEEELAEIKASLARLYGPIDEMFAELKSRLEVIPTAEQRRNAERKVEEARAARGETPDGRSVDEQ